MQNTNQVTLTLFSIFCSFQNQRTHQIFPRVRYVYFTEAARAKDHSRMVEEGCYVNITLEEQTSKTLYSKAENSSPYVQYNTDGAIELGEMHDSCTLQGLARTYYTTPALLEKAKSEFDAAKKELYAFADRFWDNNWN